MATLFDRINAGNRVLRSPLSQGLIGAGSAILGSDLPFFQALGQGIPAGLQAAAAAEQQAREREALSRLSAGAGGDFQDLIRSLLAVGAVEPAYKLSQIYANVAPDAARAPQIREGLDPATGQPAFFRIGPTGEAEVVPGGAPAPDPATSGQLKVIATDKGLKYARWDPRTNEFTPTEKEPPQQVLSEARQKANFFAQFLDRQDRAFEMFGQNAPGRFEQTAQDFGVRELTSEQMQILDAASRMYAEAWLRITSGAAIRPEEIDGAKAIFVPRPGDKPATLRWKFQNRQDLKNALKSAAGKQAIQASLIDQSLQGLSADALELLGR